MPNMLQLSLRVDRKDLLVFWLYLVLIYPIYTDHIKYLATLSLHGNKSYKRSVGHSFNIRMQILLSCLIYTVHYESFWFSA